MESLCKDLKDVQMLIFKYMETHQHILKMLKAPTIVEPPSPMMPLRKMVANRSSFPLDHYFDLPQKMRVFQ
ncbi:hypothetical protein LguiA_023864 [Lonicera macranthoides]